MGKTYTVKQVAKALGFSTNTVYKYLEEGKIKATRLGKEGRFRISESEILRLVGENKIEDLSSSQVEQHREETVYQVENSTENHIHIPQLPENIENPSLFDWFVALMAIFVGISYMLFPYYMLDYEFKNYLSIVQSFKYSLIVLGIGLVGADVFKVKGRFHRDFFHLLLGINFFSLAVIFYLLNQYLSMIGNLGIALIIFLTLFIRFNEVIRFSVLVTFMGLLTGIIYWIDPSQFILPGLVYWIDANKILFIILWFFGIFGFMSISLMAYVKGGFFLKLMSGLLAIGAYSYASLNLGLLHWDEAVYALVLGSFGLILPTYKKFELFTRGSKRELLLSFIWLAGVILIGIGLVYYTQLTFRNYLFAENKKSLDQAVETINQFVDDGSRSVTFFATNSDLVKELSSKKPDEKNLAELLKNFYLSSSVFRRVSFIDNTGKGVVIYPADNSFKGEDFSDRQYYQEVEAGKRIVISEGFRTRLQVRDRATVLIAAQILDNDNQFLGVLVGSVDLNKLQSLIQKYELGSGGTFTIADQHNQIIIHSDSNKLLQTISINQALILASQGKTGELTDYGEDKKMYLQTYQNIPKLGWSITAKQPLIEISAQNSTVAFMVFLVTLISGVGSLLVIINRQRTKVKIEE